MTYLASPSSEGTNAGTGERWQGPKVAYAFSRRFGNAVERNRGRRRLRDAFAQGWHRHAEAEAPLNGAFMLSANRSILTASFPNVVTDVEQCLGRLSGATASAGRSC